MNFKRKFFIFVLILIGVIGFYNYIFNINAIKNIPTGELILESKSPSKNHTIKIYLVGGSATVDHAIRGEVINKLGFKKNIYWAYHENTANVEWINENTIIINDKKICFKNESYDWRVN